MPSATLHFKSALLHCKKCHLTLSKCHFLLYGAWSACFRGTVTMFASRARSETGRSAIIFEMSPVMLKKDVRQIDGLQKFV